MEKTQPSSFVADLRSTLLHNRFFLLIGGETLSSAGDWFTTIALSIILFQQSESPLGVGLLFSIRMLPPILFGLFGGMCADSLPKKKILIASELFRGACILSLFFAHEPLYAYGIIFLVAMANAFSHPALMAAIKECTREEDIGRASTLVTASKLLAMIMGTGLASWLAGYVGLRFLFLIDASTFFLFVVCLLPLKLSRSNEKSDAPLKSRLQLLPFLREIRCCAHVAPVLLTTLLFGFLISLWLTLQLSVFAECFSKDVEDLALVRLITSVGLAFGVFLAFRLSQVRDVILSGVGFATFAIALLSAGVVSRGALLLLVTASLGLFEALHMSGNRSYLLRASSRDNSGKMMSVRKICESIGFIAANVVVALFSPVCDAATLLFACSFAALLIFAMAHRKLIAEAFRGEKAIRWVLKQITDCLPVKVMKDPEGHPFLYRYHLLALSKNGPGLCIHRFCASDPDRGFHDHPWSHAGSFVLAGRYEERLNPLRPEETGRSVTAGQFNYVNGKHVFHRVMLAQGEDCWTIFAYGRRTKGWGFKNVRLGKESYKAMATQVKDLDGGWWKSAPRGWQIEPVTV